jgi:hypothetical protein
MLWRKSSLAVDALVRLTYHGCAYFSPELARAFGVVTDNEWGSNLIDAASANFILR